MRKMQDREEYDAELQARVEAGLPEEERPVRSSCDSISWDHAAFLSDIAVKKKKTDSRGNGHCNLVLGGRGLLVVVIGIRRGPTWIY